MAQVVEHILGKDEVPGSNPGISSRPDISGLLFYICRGTSALPNVERTQSDPLNLSVNTVVGSNRKNSALLTEGAFIMLISFAQTERIMKNETIKDTLAC